MRKNKEKRADMYEEPNFSRNSQLRPLYCIGGNTIKWPPLDERETVNYHFFIIITFTNLYELLLLYWSQYSCHCV